MKRILTITLLILLLSACMPPVDNIARQTKEVGIVKSCEDFYIGVNGKIYPSMMFYGPSIAVGDTIEYTVIEYKYGRVVFTIIGVNGQEIVK